MGAKLFTTEEKALVKKMWKKGKTDKEIAKALVKDRPRVTDQSICSLRHRQGWGRKRKSPKGSKVTPALPSAPPSVQQPKRSGFEVVIRFPNGREAKSPITKRRAEELALKILIGEL